MNPYKNLCNTKYNTLTWTLIIFITLAYMAMPFYLTIASLWLFATTGKFVDLLWQTTICAVVGVYISWFTGRSCLKECNLKDLSDEEIVEDLSDEAEIV